MQKYEKSHSHHDYGTFYYVSVHLFRIFLFVLIGMSFSGTSCIGYLGSLSENPINACH